MNSQDYNLQYIRFITDNQQHVAIIDAIICQHCSSKTCLRICPTDVFTSSEAMENRIIVHWQRCIECGACRLACPHVNIDFDYPRGGYGVLYHEG